MAVLLPDREVISVVFIYSSDISRSYLISSDINKCYSNKINTLITSNNQSTESTENANVD